MTGLSKVPELLKQDLPKHVAIIMDGNGRWAQRQGKTRITGHRAGVKSVRSTLVAAKEIGIKSLTLFAFSSENWRRPEQEVNWLMDLFMIVLRREVKDLKNNGIKLNIIGDLSKFPPKLYKYIVKAQDSTSSNSDLIVNVAANYGGKWDITQACQKLATQVEQGTLSANSINEDLISKNLSTYNQPDIDLMIRTGGEYRISNFILWQAAYAELLFIDKLWPDFTGEDFGLAIETFVKRQRRFGLTGVQVEEIKSSK